MRQDLKHLACIFLGAATASGWWLLYEMRDSAEDWMAWWIRGIAGTITVLVGAWVLFTIAEWLRREP